MDRHVLIMTFGKTHDAPEFRIRCLPRDKQTSAVFLDALGKYPRTLSGDCFRLQWMPLYAPEVAAVPLVAGLEIGPKPLPKSFLKARLSAIDYADPRCGPFPHGLGRLPASDGRKRLQHRSCEGLCDLRWPFPTPQRPVQGLFPRSLPGCRSAAPHG